MVPYNNDGKRIVRSWSGSGTTGDYFYETEDGRIWHQPLVMPDYSRATAPPRLGTIFNNRIF